MPDSLPIENLQPIVFIETITDPEVSNRLTENNNVEDEDSDIDLSHAIGQASEEISNMKSICGLDDENDRSDDENIAEFQADVSFVHQNTSSSISIGKIIFFLIII